MSASSSILEIDPREGGSYVIAGEPEPSGFRGWWKASKAQVKAYRKIQTIYHGFQFYKTAEGNANGYAYKANQYGVWLRTSDGVYREIREILLALRPPE